MIFEKQNDNPFEIQVSFHKVIEALEEIALSDVDYRVNYAKGLLAQVAKVPELRDGITSLDTLKVHKDLIRNLLSDLFPTALTRNEIKAVTIPFHYLTFNYSERFQNILNHAGPDFDMEIRDFDERQFYIMSCCLVLSVYYGYRFEYTQPFFYDIPDEEGIIHHYRVLYNADFIEISPTEKAIAITPEDADLLLDNFDNYEMWREKFPVGSWMLKGFGIMNLYDNTVEGAISILKSTLLISEEEKQKTKEQNPESFQNIFRSIYRIPDLRIGYAEFNPDNLQFSIPQFNENIPSYLISKEMEENCKNALCGCSFETLVEEKKYLAISNVEAYGKANPDQADFVKHLLDQDIHSCIFAPVVKDGRMLGVVELVSSEPKRLNSINANKLDMIMPYLVDSMARFYADLQNQVDAIIQKEYTAIHPSVYWKFRDEAVLHTTDKSNRDQPFREIVFKDVYPLYGQIDIKGSSVARNEAIQKDLVGQIDMLLSLFKELSQKHPLPVIEQNVFELEKLETQLKMQLKADTESVIQNYIQNEIHPELDYFQSIDPEIKTKIDEYLASLDPKINMIYDARKDFDEALSVINKKMASVLDQKQETAQQFFPHYYERFKTDGVEHNLYIGASIAPKTQYNPIYLNNLRLWQLQAMCDMENEYFRLKPTLPYELDVTSLILVYSTPISIRFRMDEKRFDVDGTYNARYEVVKKRIDKSFIKGTRERITEKGKITIVYSQAQEETEYRRYIRLLQHKNRLGKVVESFAVEDLQGVTGLKALRVEVLYDKGTDAGYTYADLVNELSAK